MNRRTTLTRSQQGFSLITALILLVMMLLLGVTAMKNANLEEKMAGGAMDQNVAFQAAENGLRDAEAYITNSLTSTSAFTTACTAGLCLPSTTSSAVWESIDWTGNIPISYGSQTNATPLPEVVTQPEYIIELMAPNVQLDSESAKLPGSRLGGTMFRITAMGYGKRAGTQVMLQSVFVKQ